MKDFLILVGVTFLALLIRDRFGLSAVMIPLLSVGVLIGALGAFKYSGENKVRVHAYLAGATVAAVLFLFAVGNNAAIMVVLISYCVSWLLLVGEFYEIKHSDVSGDDTKIVGDADAKVG